MKITRFNPFLLILLLPYFTFAGDVKGKFQKERKISKAYIVNSTAMLDLSNKYGNVYVTTWDQDKTQIDVIIKVGGNDSDVVTRRFNSIDVAFKATTALVGANTQIGSMSCSSTVTMDISYTVKIPKKGGVTLENQYGATVLGEINGKAHITCKYGSLKLDALNSNANFVDLQYCDSSKFGYINAGTIDTGYSDISLTKANVLKLKSQYTNVKMGEVGDINMVASYGDINLTKSAKVAGQGEYISMRFGSVSNILNLTTEYSQIKILNLEKTVKNVAIHGDYTSIDIKYDEAIAFDFEFDLKHTALQGGGSFKYSQKTEKSSDAYYKGYYRNSGNSRIYIKSDYGGLNFSKS